VRQDVSQSWDAEHSPFGHTYVSTVRLGIEKKEVS
jgi:hypothetical protein